MRAWLRRRFWNWDTLRIWPSRPLTVAQVDALLKETFLPAIREELNRKPLLLQMLEDRR